MFYEYLSNILLILVAVLCNVFAQFSPDFPTFSEQKIKDWFINKLHIKRQCETALRYACGAVWVSDCLCGPCMTRVIEAEKKKSIKQVMDELKDKWTITLKDEISGNTFSVFLDKKPH